MENFKTSGSGDKICCKIIVAQIFLEKIAVEVDSVDYIDSIEEVKKEIYQEYTENDRYVHDENPTILVLDETSPFLDVFCDEYEASLKWER